MQVYRDLVKKYPTFRERSEIPEVCCCTYVFVHVHSRHIRIYMHTVCIFTCRYLHTYVCIYAYVCIYMYYTYVYVHTLHTYVCIYTYVLTYLRTYVYACTRIHVHIYIFVCVCVCVCVSVCVCILIYMYICIGLHGDFAAALEGVWC